MSLSDKSDGVRKLMKDAEYFAGELARRLEALERAEGGRRRSEWQQAAAFARRLRSYVRERQDLDQRRERLAALAASRGQR